MPEQIKRNAEEKLAELEKEYSRLHAMVEENRARIAKFDAMKQIVENNRQKIQDLMKTPPAEFVKHEGVWKKALEDWEEDMRMFGQT